jgi:hypothetical protein
MPSIRLPPSTAVTTKIDFNWTTEEVGPEVFESARGRHEYGLGKGPLTTQP